MSTYSEEVAKRLERNLTVAEIVKLNAATYYRFDPYGETKLKDVVVMYSHIGYGGHLDEPLDEEEDAYDAVAADDFERALLVAARTARTRVLREAIEAVEIPPVLTEDWKDDPCPSCGGRGWHDDHCRFEEET
jgi:hypothetical protein